MEAVIGIGIDQVEVQRVRDAIDRHPQRFPARVYTDEEIDYCRRGAHAAQRFAARFAAKEAVMKALATGWSAGVTFRDIEVLRSEAGAPSVRLSGEAQELAQRLGVLRIHLSMTHTAEHALAMVVLSGGVP